VPAKNAGDLCAYLEGFLHLIGYRPQ
jgi:hypothetical protein